MSYDDKALAERPAEPRPDPWDTAKHGAPDPSWPPEAQLRWFSRYSHILPLLAAEIARYAGVLHSEHHAGTFVPGLDSCPEHDRADYEARVRRMRLR